MLSSLQCPFSITLHNVPAVTEETSCTPRPANLAIRWPEPKKLICWVVVSAVFLELHSWNNFHSLFIYLFIFKITFLNPYLEMRNSGLLFFFCIKCTAGKQKKNNMWFIGILICFKPAKPTEFPRQPLRVKAHQRKKMKKKKKKEFHVTWGAFTVASEATVGRCTEKMSLPPMLCICACSAIQFRLE